jgi:glycosyltransferase involved in cell wall biosynthesis
MPKSIRDASLILNHAVFTRVSPGHPRRREPYCLFIGALHGRKGPRLAVRALAHTPEAVRLVMVGDGPERPALKRLARRLNVAQRVEFRGNMARAKVLALMAEAGAIVFTGLREEGGIALAEAMCRGAPVVVLAHGGARTIAAASTDASRVILIPPGSVGDTARRIAMAMTQFIQHPPAAQWPALDAGDARATLRHALDRALLAGGGRW